MKKAEILKHYLHAALWTAELDALDITDITDTSVKQAKKDVNTFLKKANGLLDGMSEDQIGHDLWLTRNSHGVGFWDRGLGEIGDKLTKIANNMKEKNVFNDDGVVTIE